MVSACHNIFYTAVWQIIKDNNETFQTKQLTEPRNGLVTKPGRLNGLLRMLQTFKPRTNMTSGSTGQLFTF